MQYPPLSVSNFYPVILPHSYSQVVLPELREILQVLFNELPEAQEEYELAEDFLSELMGNKNNYDSYRTDLVCFLNWVWAHKLEVGSIRRKEMTQFIFFCNTPPQELIAKAAPRTVLTDSKYRDEFILNPDWRPFKNPSIEMPYSRSQATIAKQLSVISSFYTYLNDCEYCDHNPAALVLRRLNIGSLDNVKPHDEVDRSLSILQLATLLDVIEDLASENRDKYERTRFLVYLMILAFPRRSEVSASTTYSPKMSDFIRVRVGDEFRYVFHIRRAKRGRSRKVLCPRKLVDALVRYRRFLGLTDYPDSNDNSPLFTRHRPASHGRDAGIVDANLSSNSIYNLIKEIFHFTASRLEDMEEFEEADILRSLSAHSTRHTGISLALSAGRSPEKLMLDSGHNSYSAFKRYVTTKVDFRVGEVDLIDKVLDSF
ncbi:site-specific integrase [Vibrio sp. Y2-5]|uniref:tyrosine-type recombinase/integrase n=1 Tax=Vibrio sp. Y2-5 TaxID=2743977 RepID=UPI0016614EDF|nr:site-specific integrase [Vibrio sp. Y2-5]MBD0788010.1 site-specific integrase [Vibrio sp. Y2-5]